MNGKYRFVSAPKDLYACAKCDKHHTKTGEYCGGVGESHCRGGYLVAITKSAVVRGKVRGG